MTIKINYDINENKINNWLEELDNDRKKLFDDIKTSKTNDKVKEEKIYKIEQIQRSLLSYKKILNKEKAENEKY
jgi:hypothetical protein